MIYNLGYIFLLFAVSLYSQIPANRILEEDELFEYLKKDVADLVLQRNENTPHDKLITYLKEQLKTRYYFNWSDFQSQFQVYEKFFPEQEKKHDSLAKYHVSRYSPEAQWILPYKNLRGEEVTAYELRHLARQQKSADMCLMHFYQNQESGYPDYFTGQVTGLNKAFLERNYDNAGNGVYEVFRAGKRIHNWLFCHAVYMNDSSYTIEKQSLLVRTILHHGAHLYKHLGQYRPGNHHTKGLVALFEIAVIFSDFKDSEKWQKRALDGIMEHLRREVNADGFQFERSVHYHIGDIENYFRVYQLAKRNGLKLPGEYINTFRNMFDALIVIARPDKKLPVLQDDTDKPFSESNGITDVMYLANLMFQKPKYAFFSGQKPPLDYFWLINETEQKTESSNIAPEILSAELPETGYYVMRDGWHKSSLQMVFSAGLSTVKPDHQHGDMLGITAFGLESVLLPNYQVAYKYDDLPFWKNSWTKNVALVDNHEQGRNWKPNSGGSGFGKWEILPHPAVLQWIKNDLFDYIAATHDGFKDLGVSYNREVIFIKDGYWLVFDNFYSEGEHQYQQIWQGNYEINSDKQVFRKIENDRTFYISQLNPQNYDIKRNDFREKHNLVFLTTQNRDFSFNTLLFPAENSKFNPANISVLKEDFNTGFLSCDAENILKAGDNYLLINVSQIHVKSTEIVLSSPCKFFAAKSRDRVELTMLNTDKIPLITQDKNSGNSLTNEWKPGEIRIYKKEEN